MKRVGLTAEAQRFAEKLAEKTGGLGLLCRAMLFVRSYKVL